MVSWGGKITIITSILNSIPIYAMSVLPIPKKIISQIQRSIADFLWNQGSEKRHHWVAWDKISKAVEDGGLNLKLLAEMSLFWKSNLAWSFIQNKSLWAKFMNQKYTIGNLTVSDSKFWKGLEPICSDLLEKSFWKIGEGDIGFWSKKWWPMDITAINHYNLPDDTFKRIWADPRRKDSYIAALPVELQDFAKNIQLSNVEDHLIWKPAEDGKFSSRKYRISLQNRSSSGFHWWKNFWRPWIPTKCSCFMWKCLNKAVPVELTIKKSGIYLASKCICCDYSHEESLDHLVIFSDAAKKVWGFFHRIYGLQFNYQSLYQAAYVWGNCHTSSQLDCLKVLSFTVAVWEIWKWRNKCIHDQPEDSSSIIHKIVHQLQQLNFLIVPSRKAKWSEELAMSSLHLPILLPKARIGKWISWKSSSQGFTLNFHGMISSNQGRGGFLIRDSKGSILRYHRWSFPRATSSFSASLESLKTAMDIVDAGGWSIAEIQGDSVDFMLCLQGKKSSPWICSDLMVDLRKRCSDIPSKAIEREGNLAAISLAESSGEDDVASCRKFQTAVREDGSGLRRWSWARL